MATLTSARRVTVVTPHARVDVALPAQSTIAELVPQLVRLSGATNQTSPDNPGWVLTRLGDAPLTPGATVTAAALRDGEVLYLNPRERYVAPMLFDDVVDAIANAAEHAPGAWRAGVARRIAIGVGALLFIGATLLLVASVGGTPIAPAGAGVIALLAVLGGGALSRAYADADGGAACALAGVPAALTAGLSALPPHHPWTLDAAPLALGLGAVTAYCVPAAVLVAHRLDWFVAAILAAGSGAITAAVVRLAHIRPAGGVAVLAVVVTAAGALAPMLALRLGRLPLPRVPTDAESFRADERPTLGPDMITRTTTAQSLLSGLLAGCGLASLGASIVLLRDDAPWQAVLCLVLGLVWLLRSRSYAAAGQRVVLLVTGLAQLVGCGTWLAVMGYHLAMLVGFAVLITAGISSLSYARRVVEGRHSPYWSRLMDAAEFLGLIAMVPIAGAILGAYQAVRDVVH